MAEILGAELQVDRLISADPTNGVLAALNTAGAAVNLVAWSPLTGDVTYSAPDGTGTNTRRHIFDRPLNVTAATTASSGSILIAATDPGMRLRVTGGTVDKSQYEWRAIAAGGSNDYLQLRKINDANTVFTELLHIDAIGVVAIGTLVTTSASAGNVVLGHNARLRWVNSAGTDTISILVATNYSGVNALLIGENGLVVGIGTPANIAGAEAGEIVLANEKGIRSALGATTVKMLYTDSGGQIHVGYTDKTGVCIGADTAATLWPGSGGALGRIVIDTTNNRFVYYSGGARYYLSGTAF